VGEIVEFALVVIVYEVMALEEEIVVIVYA
jgi:hypothetical protein